MEIKQIAEIQLKCNLDNVKNILTRYTNAKRNNLHPRTIGAIKKDFFLYIRELKSILQGAKQNKTKLEIKEEQKDFFNYLIRTYNIID